MGLLGEKAYFYSFLFSGDFSTTTGPNSPLRTCDAAGRVTDAVALWTSHGFPASQILL